MASAVGQFGDLCMSSVKRVCGIKDFGNIFPGHGGVLDRFDSVIFVNVVLFGIVLFINYFVGGFGW